MLEKESASKSTYGSHRKKDQAMDMIDLMGVIIVMTALARLIFV